MRHVTIIKIGYQMFALTNKTDVGKLIDLMSKIIPVESDYVEGIGRVLFPAEKTRDVSVEFNQEFYPSKPASPTREVKPARHMRSASKALPYDSNNILRLNG